MECRFTMNDTEIDNLFNLLKENNLSENIGDEIVDDHENDGYTCEYCSGTLVLEDGCYYCLDCGCVNTINICQDAEYRNYGSADSKQSDPTRVGMPTNNLLPESSMGTVISKSKFGNDKMLFNKIRMYHQWGSMPYKERSLWKVYDTLAAKAQRAGINDIIIQDAKKMYKTLSETKISRGINRKSLVASCIFIACKKQSVPRSSKEVAQIFDISTNDMTKGCKHFSEIMYMAKMPSNYTVQSSNPIKYINRYCSRLNIPQNIIHIIEFTTLKAVDLEIIEDHNSCSLASGAIYFVVYILNLMSPTKKQIAEVCISSEVTISKCFKLLYDYKECLIPNKVIVEYDIKF